MVVLLLSLLGLCAPSPVPDQASGISFDSLAQRGITRVYNLEFEEAEVDFRALIQLDNHHPAGYFFLAMVDWWRILIDIENETLDKKFFGELDGVIDMCDSLLEGNPRDMNALFFKGGAIGFKGRLKFHRNDYLAAANAGRAALPIVQEARERDPANSDILLGTGIYDYYAEVIPAEYPIVKPLLLFIPSGDKQRGIAELTQAAEHGRYASIEATYFLLQIYYFYERDYGRALGYARSLHARFPRNMLFHRYVGRCQAALGDWKGVRGIFDEILLRAKGGWRGYGAVTEREARYYAGYCDMVEKNFDSALTHFYRCDEISRSLDRGEPSGFMSMANLKIGNIYDAQGKRELAVEQYRKVLDMPEYKGSHTLAESFLKEPYRQ